MNGRAIWQAATAAQTFDDRKILFVLCLRYLVVHILPSKRFVILCIFSFVQ